MPRNVEIKARAANFDEIRAKAEDIVPQSDVIKQRDVFFKVPKGRLKLRFLQDRPSKLIFYDRPDQAGPKLSDYRIAEIDKPDELEGVLGLAYGVMGVVEKTRFLYLIGQTRLHLDEVAGLGRFVELEVVLEDDQTAEQGQEIAKELMRKLAINDEGLIECAYMDMILNKQ